MNILGGLLCSACQGAHFIRHNGKASARLTGARRPAAILLWSGVFGAGLLSATDGLVQWMAGGMKDFVPTGAVTAVIGAPLLLALLGGLKARHRPLPSARPQMLAPRAEQTLTMPEMPNVTVG